MPEIIHPSIEHRPTLHLQGWTGGHDSWVDREVFVPVEDASLAEHPRGPRGQFVGADLLNRTHKVVWTFHAHQRELYEQVRTLLNDAKGMARFAQGG